MKTRRSRYRTGSIRKLVHSAGGFSWEFRYYSTNKDGTRKSCSESFPGHLYPTQKAVRDAVGESLAAMNANTLEGKANATLNTILDRYIRDELPSLQLSTQETHTGTIENYVRPRWGEIKLSRIRAMDVKVWIDGLKIGPASKTRIRNMISIMFDRAMLWEYIPINRNPMQLVRVKGSSKRSRAIVIITPEECLAIIKFLPEPYNLMVLICACLGLSVSEMSALKWTDFDWTSKTVTINRAFTHGNIQEAPKTMARGAELPLYDSLAAKLEEWHSRCDPGEEFVFTSPRTGRPYSASTMLTRYLKPAAEKAGVQGFGWHSLRHSYKSWCSAEKIAPGMMKDLMRHADIGTTMDVYGHTLTNELRNANSLVARKLFPK
jgi:integrase